MGVGPLVLAGAEARDVRSAMTFVRAQRPDVLVLDLNMPDEPILPAIPEYLEVSPDPAIVVLTMQNDPASPARRCVLARSDTC